MSSKSCTTCSVRRSVVEFPSRDRCPNWNRGVCFDCHKAMSKRYYIANKDRLKKYYADNYETIKVQRKTQYWRTRTLSIAAAVQWARDNPERRREIRRKWRLANPVKVQLAGNRTHAYRKGADGSFTHAEWLSLQKQYKGCCAYCYVAVGKTIDHKI